MDRQARSTLSTPLTKKCLMGIVATLGVLFLERDLFIFFVPFRRIFLGSTKASSTFPYFGTTNRKSQTKLDRQCSSLKRTKRVTHQSPAISSKWHLIPRTSTRMRTYFPHLCLLLERNFLAPCFALDRFSNTMIMLRFIHLQISIQYYILLSLQSLIGL